MNPAVIVALITAAGAIVVAVIGLLGSRRERRQTKDDLAAITAALHPNSGSSLRDAVDRIELNVREVRRTQVQHGERLASLEATRDYGTYSRRKER